LSRALKADAVAAEEGCMRITIPCPECAGEKRPLRACEGCRSEGAADHELTTWRALLHAFHISRISAEPRRAVAPAPGRARPIRVSVLIDDAGESAEMPLEIPESSIPAADPLSFDWGESTGFRLRKSA
jgi:hypothetical protein